MPYQVLLNIKGKQSVERFFDNEEQRNKFVEDFELSMYEKGITLIEAPRHPLFVSFNLFNKKINIGYITLYL